MITLGHAWFRGEASGVEVEIEYAQVIEQRDGFAEHERDFTDWSVALRETGFDPGTLGRLEALAPGEAVEL